MLKTGRTFYATGIAGIGVQQFIYADFRPVILPQFTTPFPALSLLAYLAGAALFASAIIILLNKKAKTPAIILGIVFLLIKAMRSPAYLKHWLLVESLW